LRYLRERAGLSQAVLAMRAGLGLTTLKALEGDRRHQPHSHTLELLAEALGLTTTDREALLESARAGEPTGRAPGVRRLKLPREPRQAQLEGSRLPTWLTALVGREAEVESVRRLLDPVGSVVRLLTLVGTGGVGKTRLALAAAASLTETYVDGVIFVDLAPLRDARLVPAAIAHALGLREGGGRSANELLLEDLRGRQILLVLDNFEHVLEARPMVGELLRRCPRVAVLVTSRAALRVQGERRFAVAPLVTPNAEADTSLEDIASSPAVQLFVTRAQEVAGDFALTEATAATVASICRHVDGIPLAIELAAARVPLLSIGILLRRLERRLPLLTAGDADLPQRQQTLRATLGWSHDLLDPAAQVLFRRVSVFAGGWTLDAVETVCAGGALPVDDVLDRLQVLADSSLVRRQEERGEEPRNGMLDTIREYAAEQLEASGELQLIRARHAEFYARLAEPLDADVQTVSLWGRSPAPVLTDQALDRLEMELDNVVAALDCWLSTARVAEGLRLAVAANWSWSRRGQYTAARHWLDAVLDLADRAAPPAAFRAERAVALTEAGTLAGLQGDREQARSFFRRSVAVWREVDHAPGLATALATLGHAEWVAGDAETAIALLEESLARSRAANVAHTVAISLRNLGLVARSQGSYARADALFDEAAAQVLPTGWYRGYSLARSLSCLGRVAFLRNDMARARACFRQAFEVIRQAGVTGQALADCLDWQAALEAVQGHPRYAVRLFGAADHHWRTSGARRYLPDEAAYRRDLAQVRVAMDEPAFAATWAEGAAMPPRQAIAYALRELD
jgi:predicted ATPase/transcriptional regulator with XRE-family HTH domain